MIDLSNVDILRGSFTCPEVKNIMELPTTALVSLLLRIQPILTHTAVVTVSSDGILSLTTPSYVVPRDSFPVALYPRWSASVIKLGYRKLNLNWREYLEDIDD